MSASPAIAIAPRGSIPRGAVPFRVDILLLGLILGLCNLPLVFGGGTSDLSFQIAPVLAGEWWRLFTHPFAHVSWYHLLLDGAAFFGLYANLLPGQPARRVFCLVASAFGSLAFALCFSPLIRLHGLCGLSGVAHGLMAVSALELLTTRGTDRPTRVLAMCSLLGVTGKCLMECTTGHALFGAMHFGLIGTPILQCHAGGVLGGVTAFLLSRSSKREPNPHPTTCSAT